MFFAMFIINSIGFLFNGVEVIEAVVLIFNVWHGKLYEIFVATIKHKPNNRIRLVLSDVFTQPLTKLWNEI